MGYASLRWFVPLFLITLLFPPWTSFYVGALRLSVYRVVLLGTFAPALLAVFRGSCGKARPCDWLVLIHVVWSAVALAVHHPIDQAAQSGGIYIVEALGAYLLARAFVRNEQQFRSVIRILTILVSLLVCFTLPEAITGKNLFQPGVFLERRMGLARAYGPFDHPILNGVFCGSILGMAWYGWGHDFRFRFGVLARGLWIVIGACMSVSSGAVATFSTQIFLIAWELSTRRLPKRWLVLCLLACAAYGYVSIASNRSPMAVGISYLTFNPTTAYGRIVIWDYGTASVGRNPIFGIGFNSWEHPTWMSDSMDNFWLYTAVVYGLPASICLVAAVLYLLIRTGRKNGISMACQACRAGWMISIMGMSIGAFTVHLWNAILVYFFFLLGSGAWLLDAPTETQR